MPKRPFFLGLGNKVVPVNRRMEETKGLAQKLINNPPMAIKFARRRVNVGMQLDIM
jgi:1,4-dihydroxy-2-naphthoyl-CoA synthase